MSMPTRNVVLTEQQHAFVESLVRSGRYQNASEVLREGLRMVERREVEESARLAALRAATERGWDDIAVGRFTDVAEDDLDDFVRQLGERPAAQGHSHSG